MTRGLKMSNTNDMTKDVPIKVIIRFSIPLLIGTLFQQAYNIIDTMIAGYNLKDDAIVYRQTKDKKMKV